MKVSYIGLWKLLLGKDCKKGLGKMAELSSTTVAKMEKDESVSNKVFEGICKYLDCGVNDIITYE